MRNLQYTAAGAFLALPRERSLGTTGAAVVKEAKRMAEKMVVVDNENFIIKE